MKKKGHNKNEKRDNNCSFLLDALSAIGAALLIGGFITLSILLSLPTLILLIATTVPLVLIGATVAIVASLVCCLPSSTRATSNFSILPSGIGLKTNKHFHFNTKGIFGEDSPKHTHDDHAAGIVPN